MARREPFARTRKGDFRLDLEPHERETLAHLAREFRGLLTARTPSSDPSLQRLFPPAYPDDPLQNFDYERVAGADLLSGRLDGLDTVERTAGAERLREDEVLTWMRVLNDIRLVMGSRLDITEETSFEDFEDDEEAAVAFELYAYLTWLVDTAVEALGDPAP